jgi:transcription elongation factor SPT4
LADHVYKLRAPKPAKKSEGLYGLLDSANTSCDYHSLQHYTRFRTDLCSQRFLKEGCPNCEDFLRLQGSIDAIAECTSQVFEGLITLAEPSKSWVAKWQRLDGYVRGVYATKVSGILPEEVIDTMESEARVKYIP